MNYYIFAILVLMACTFINGVYQWGAKDIDDTKFTSVVLMTSLIAWLIYMSGALFLP